METSIIVFSGIVVCGIFALPLVLRGVRMLFSMYLDYQDKKDEKQKQQEIADAKDKLKIAADYGTLTDLVDAAKELGDKKKEKEELKKK